MGVFFLIVSIASGLLVWPIERLLYNRLSYNKVAFTLISLNLWLLFLFMGWKNGKEIWSGGGKFLFLGMGFLGYLFTILASSAGSHLAHGKSLLDPFTEILKFDPYTPLIFPTRATIVIIFVIFGTALFFIAKKFQARGIKK